LTTRQVLPHWARILACLVFISLLGGCGSSAKPPTLHVAGVPRLHFDYDAAAPLGYVDHGRVKGRGNLVSVDPIRYIAAARPGSVLLEDGTRDEIVPHAALLNVIHAAPQGTTVRWYAARHALNRTAYHDAFDWLAQKLPIDGPRVA
jgi:hypothetical protein